MPKTIHRTAERGKNAAKEISDQAQEKIDELQDHVDNWRDQASEKWQEVKKTASGQAAKADRYAHDNPWQMAAIGAVAGFLLAALVMRKRD